MYMKLPECRNQRSEMVGCKLLEVWRSNRLVGGRFVGDRPQDDGRSVLVASDEFRHDVEVMQQTAIAEILIAEKHRMKCVGLQKEFMKKQRGIDRAY